MGTHPTADSPVQAPCVICNDEGWVCEHHPDTPWLNGESCCGGAGRPCLCQPLTTAEVNALPARVRSYIHDLHMGYDPRGDVRRQVIELQISRENATALALETVRLTKIVHRLLREHVENKSQIR